MENKVIVIDHYIAFGAINDPKTLNQKIEAELKNHKLYKVIAATTSTAFGKSDNGFTRQCWVTTLVLERKKR